MKLQRKRGRYFPRTTEIIQRLLRIDMRKHAHYKFASSLTLKCIHCRKEAFKRQTKYNNILVSLLKTFHTIRKYICKVRGCRFLSWLEMKSFDKV